MIDPIKDNKLPQGGYGAIFVGRLSQEKGVETLVSAWRDIEYPLTIVGDGPIKKSLQRIASENVKFVGSKKHGEVIDHIAKSAFMTFPSELYEGFPMSSLEAMALGKPVVASDLGPRRELVEEGVTGLLFEAGNSVDLKQKVCQLIENVNKASKMGEIAREQYLRMYNPQVITES
ncbi:MAG: glycosyltransferase family 4 protein [Phycisphaerales bacterium]|nr:MAG: glycosyltransferase family 4 protein [Phycisphaerales bacterium]